MCSSDLFDSLSLFVQRPEGIAEQVRRVIFSLELFEPVPVLAEASFGLVYGFTATKELEFVVRNHE